MAAMTIDPAQAQQSSETQAGCHLCNLLLTPEHEAEWRIYGLTKAFQHGSTTQEPGIYFVLCHLCGECVDNADQKQDPTLGTYGELARRAPRFADAPSNLELARFALFLANMIGNSVRIRLDQLRDFKASYS